MSRTINLAVFTLLAVFLTVAPAGAVDKTLSVSSASAVQGERIEVNIMLDDAANTAGAAFTVAYNKTILTLIQVESDFFGTFATQNITPSQIVVDNITYNGPLLFNTNNVPAGVMLAAARKDNGSGTNVTIFTLTFTIAASAPAGSYLVTVTDSTIYNTAVGYSASGETIPLLVGIDGTSFVNHTVPVRNPGTITVQPFEDYDGDGINDNWERANVLPSTEPEIALTIFSATGDFDNDGYTDLQEYLSRGITDQAGALFNPTVVNAPGSAVNVDSDFWTLMIPVIIQHAKQP